MEAKAKLFAAKFHIQKPVDAIEDVEWLAYFQVGMDHQTDQYTDLAVKIKAKIIMGDKELDPDKRMDKWIHDYWTLLQRNHMMDYDANTQKQQSRRCSKAVVDFLNYVRKELRHTLKYLRAAASSDIPKESKEMAKVLKEIQKGAKETPKQAVKQAPAVGEKRTLKCWNCGGDHNLRSCTKASEAEKEAIAKKKMAEWTAEEAARGSKPKSKTLAMDGINGGSSVSTVRGAEDVGEIPILFVTGSDPSALISRGLLELLEQTTMLDLHLVESTNAREMLGFGHVPINVSRHVILEAIDICTPEGPLTLLNINPWVEEEEEGLAITIGRPVMNTLGYDTGEFLSRAQKKRATWNLKGLLAEDIGTSTMVQKSLKMQHYEKEMLDKSDDSDDEDLAPGVTGAAKVKLVLAQKVEKAANRGMSTAGLARLTQLLKKFEDVFRVDFASDPPVRVKPLVVRIKPDAVPLRCKTRRYAPSQMDYIRKHFAELLKYGLATKNKDSRWASPPRVVPKKN
ncbi:unnamed protein product, partial [Aphanomyces euteiches]